MFNSLVTAVASALVCVILALSGGLYLQNKKLEAEEQTVSDLRVQLSKVEVTAKTQAELVSQFERSFEESRAAEISRQTAVLDALKQVEKLSAKNVSLSNRLLGSVPQSEDTCAEANTLVNLYLKEVQSETP